MSILLTCLSFNGPNKFGQKKYIIISITSKKKKKKSQVQHKGKIYKKKKKKKGRYLHVSFVGLFFWSRIIFHGIF